MQPNEKDLSNYRLERAREDIQTAQINLENGLYILGMLFYSKWFKKQLY